MPPISYLVLAPGSQVVRLGLSNAPLPKSLPSKDLPLQPPLSLATALTFHCASLLSLSRHALEATPLAISAPPDAFPPATRRSIAHAALALLRMPSVVFLPPLAAARAATRDPLAPLLLLDVGWRCTRVLAAGVSEVVPVGVAHVNERLQQLAGLSAGTDVDDVRARACFLLPKPYRREGASGVGEAIGAGVRVSPMARVRSGEVLFDRENAEQNIAHAVANILRNEPDVYRRAGLASHVVLAGGGASIPGFAERLNTEFADVCELEEYATLKGLSQRLKVVRTSFVPALLFWVGSSILCAAGVARDAGVEVLAETYICGGTVRDPDSICDFSAAT